MLIIPVNIYAYLFKHVGFLSTCLPPIIVMEFTVDVVEQEISFVFLK
ncbi:MAG: hypothetical protein GY702_03030 [Desulfobulbaceae bacterium]|nr:hypothetical protein [Desulfobulbaceae bacterium]